MRSNLHIAVFPQIGSEELADANWMNWVVVGHLNPDMVERDWLRKLSKEFWQWPEVRKIRDDKETDDEPLVGLFLDFMDSKGYITFEPGALSWA